METQTVQEALQKVFDGFEIRAVTINGAGWVVAADVAKALGLTNARQNVAEFEEDEKGVCPIYTPGGMQNLTVLSEPGLYRLLMRTDKFADPVVGPKIRRFQRWVTHEVLPALRKDGSYSLRPAPIAVPQTLPEALRLAAQAIEEKEAAEAKLALAAPKVEAYDSLMNSEGLLTMQKAVKAIPGAPGRNKAFEILRKQHIIMQGATTPYQRYVDDGYFVCKAKDQSFGPDRKVALIITYVTPKGLEFLRKHLGAQA